MTTLWLLRPLRDAENSPPAAWIPWYDKAFGFVVRASNEREARAYAHASAGDENEKHAPWLDASQSSCVQLHAQGVAGVVIRDFHSA